MTARRSANPQSSRPQFPASQITKLTTAPRRPITGIPQSAFRNPQFLEIDYTDAGAETAGTAEPFHYLRDERNCVVALLDDSGTVAESYRYDPYGRTYVWLGEISGAPDRIWTDEAWTESDNDPRPNPLSPSYVGNPFGFTGHRFSAAGLFETPFRAYCPDLGRWLQRDKFEYGDGSNLLAYVSSDPVGLLDPYGMAGVSLQELLSGMLAGGGIAYGQATGSGESQSAEGNHPKPANPHRIPTKGLYIDKVQMPDGTVYYHKYLNGQYVVGGTVKIPPIKLGNSGFGISDDARDAANDAARAWGDALATASQLLHANAKASMNEGLAATAGAMAGPLWGWGRKDTLARHFDDHGPGVGAASADDYARMAREFYNGAAGKRLPTKIDPETGVIRIYDPKTGDFGAFNPDGTTRTFFRPARPERYWPRQPGTEHPFGNPCK